MPASWRIIRTPPTTITTEAAFWKTPDQRVGAGLALFLAPAEAAAGDQGHDPAG